MRKRYRENTPSRRRYVTVPDDGRIPEAVADEAWDTNAPTHSSKPERESEPRQPRKSKSAKRATNHKRSNIS
jgi:hypothetical protein